MWRKRDPKNLFPLGQVVSTPKALGLLGRAGVSHSELLQRHATGDWGDISAGDRALNAAAVKAGATIWSTYQVGDARVSVKTEWDRSVTTLYLPGED